MFQLTDKFLTLLHISDLHFGPPFLKQVADAVLRQAPQLGADAIVISGDLTQRARRSQFEEAKSFLGKLPELPSIVIPGNHDVPLYRVFERVANPHGLYREIISDDLNPVLQLKHAILVGLDSTAPHSAISNGRIRQQQLDHCSSVLNEAPADLMRIVVAHHPFAPAPDLLRDKTMPQSRRAIECFIDLNVEMILGGHLHRAYVGNSLDFYPGNHRDRGIVIVQCGTTTSRRGRGREAEKNTLNRIEINSTSICVTHFMYFHESDSFEPISQHIFKREPHRL